MVLKYFLSAFAIFFVILRIFADGPNTPSADPSCFEDGYVSPSVYHIGSCMSKFQVHHDIASRYSLHSAS